MRKTLPLLVVGILVLSGLRAVATPVKESLESEKISVAFSNIDLAEEKDYITINIEEANSLLIQDNKPLLPMYTHTFKFPFGTKIKSINCNPKNIQEITIEKEITPSPIKVLAGSTVQTTSQKTELTEPYPGKWYDYDIRVGLDGPVRTTFVTMYFYPVGYNPTSKTISWAKEVDIQVDYDPAGPPKTTNTEYDFIILTADEYYDELSPLVSHKTGRGVSTKIVKLSEITGGSYFPVQGRDNAEKVKYFISNAADQSNWNTKNVMLVGNKNKFPTRDTHVKVSNNDKEIFVSDLYFADFLMYNDETEECEFCDWDSNENSIFAEYKWDGGTDFMDLEPDVAIGRLAANNGGEVTTCVNKIINYENQVAYTQNWFFDLVYVGGDSFIDEEYDENGVLEGEYVNEYIMGFMDGFIPKKMWASNNVLGQVSPSGVSSINNAINEGCGFVDFSGHGNTDVWATHPHWNDNKWLPTPLGQYHSNNIDDLSNGDKLPIVVTGACSVSKFSKDTTSFSWTFVSTSGGGAIASFGATGLGYAYISSHVTSGLVEGIAIETLRSFDRGVITLGEMWTRALNEYIDYHAINNGAEYKTVLEWEMFGDPTLQIAEPSNPPVKPSTPDGPSSNLNTGVQYTYTTSTTDPDGDEVEYMFDWDDGTSSGWVGPYDSGNTGSATKSWSSAGTYQVKVTAKDEHGKVSGWSDELPVSVTKARSKDINFNALIQKFFESHPYMFPILRQLLGF